MDRELHNILAIESAVAGGSLALFRGGRQIAGWLGPADVSRAEDQLANIHSLLEENQTSRHDLQMVAVSAGPGSFTGIRIGLSTAMGLRVGLGIPMSSISVLTAMAITWKQTGRVTPAVPVGRNAICCQTFEVENGSVVPVDEPHTVPAEGFWRHRDKSTHHSRLLAHSSLFDQLSEHGDAVDYVENLAEAVGRACSGQPGITAEPLFISKQF